MPDDSNLTRTNLPPDGTFTFEPQLDAGIAAAFAADLTPGGWTHPPFLRDDPSDYSPVVLPDSAAMPKADPGRYQLLGEIAQGGMGVVLKGRDPDLGRDLAVKVLKQEFAGRAAAEQRFVEEAQVGGQLQHPGIVPVYDLGRFADGRPYFTMKLIKGRTLASHLNERPEPTHDRGRFLKVFEQMCQTVAYAHSKGVIHRDLKPANVMVGSFGEVQVMDWGLAKVLPQGGIADEEQAGRRADPGSVNDEPTVIRTARGSGAGSETQAGSVMGTPAFMPPEQAGGEIEKLDERADVFGLGAVLCVILTGQPPYVAATSDEMRLMAVRGQLAAAYGRLDACGAEPALIDLAKRCLAAERADRPRTAKNVADAMTAYLAGVEERAHRAEVERAAAEVRATEEANTRRVAEEKMAEERKRRRVQAALAAAVVGIVAVAGGGAWWVQREVAARERVEFVQQAAESARMEQERQEMAVAATAAREAIEQAYVAVEAGRWVDARNAVARAEDRLGGRDNWPDELVQAVRQSRADVDFASGMEEARLEQADEITVRRNTVNGDQWGRYRRVLVQHRWAVWEGNPEDFMPRLEASRIRGTILFGLDISSETLTEEQRKAVRTVIDRFDKDPWVKRMLAAKGDAATLQALADDPATLQRPAANIIGLEVLLHDLDHRIALYKNALGRHPRDFWIQANLSNRLVGKGTPSAALDAVGHARVAAALRPQSAGAHASLGRKLLLVNNPLEAHFEFQEAARLDPNPAFAHALVAISLRRMGKAAEADEWLRRERVDDPTLGGAHSSIAWELYRFKDHPAALAAVREAIRLRSNSAADHDLLGWLLWKTGDKVGAEQAFREALRIDASCTQAHLNLGNVLLELKRFDEAYPHIQKGHPNDSEANIRTQFGNSLAKAGRTDEAIASYRQAIQIDPKSVGAHNNLGNVLLDKKNVDGAIASYREALRLDPKFAMAHNNLGLALLQKGDLAGAIASFQEFVRIDPKDAKAHFNLGLVLRLKGDVDGAITCYRESIRIDPKFAKAHFNLGFTLLQKGNVDGAIACLREAIQIDPKLATAHFNLGVALSMNGNVDGAIASYREAVRIDPKFAKAHFNLGLALLQKGDLDGAIASFQEVVRIDPKDANARNNLGVALSMKGNVDGAIASYREGIRIDPKDANWHLSLAGAYLQKKSFDAAAGSAREAVRLAPQDFRGYFVLGLGLAQSGRPAEALRETQAAMKKFPAAAESPLTNLKYNAACYAMQCADGKGTDTPPPAERPAFRAQALMLLTADLTACQKVAPIRRAIMHTQMQPWLADPDWQSVRDPEKLKTLPAEERAAWAKLWAEVRALRDATAPPETAPPPRAGK